MTYIISDVHGDIAGLAEALKLAGILDSDHVRVNFEPVISVGDLANCVASSVEGDLACLDKVGDWIDKLIVGNHEYPYFNLNCPFGGFHFQSAIEIKLNTLASLGFIVPSVHLGEGDASALVTHAGFSWPLFESALETHDFLQYQWERDFHHSVFSNIGAARGGDSSAPGVMWCDWSEHEPQSYHQIFGHTPSRDGVRTDGTSVCIDVGGGKFGLPMIWHWED